MFTKASIIKKNALICHVFVMQKYNSKRIANDYSTSDNRYTPLRSPNGNVSAHGHGALAGHGGHTGHSGHGHHHYNHMLDDRGYPISRNSYIQKGSDKERDRDYKSCRNKYTGKSAIHLFILYNY